MNKIRLKHFASFSIIVIFLLMATASAVNKIHIGAFQYGNKIEDDEEDGTYLVLNNGDRIDGESITWKSGLVVKDQIKIDDKKFKISEVRGYRSGNVYYGRQGNEYIKRIVHGDMINVYVKFTEVTSTSTSSTGFTRTKTYTRSDHYAQRGEDGTMTVFGGQNGIKELVKDCPLAVQMASISNSQMRKAIRKNCNYLNSIFEVYNRGCR